MEDTMRQFSIGLIVGVVLSGSLGLAQNLYDRDGQPAAPRGSIQQYDYFRNRQQQLDIGAMRKQLDRQAAEQRQNQLRQPC
jgi:hypothetical protein